jgi:hypothetical protein
MPLTMWISGLGDDSRQPPVEMVDSVTFPKAHTSGGAIAALANPLLHTKIRRHAQEEQLRRPLNNTRLMALAARIASGINFENRPKGSAPIPFILRCCPAP